MKPLLLHYYITNRCNARCNFCNIWQEHPKIDADITDVYSNLHDARKAGCKFVDFTGGEPLLHPDLPRMLQKARSHGFFTSVTTNTILFPKRVHELAGLIDLLHFSIDADNQSLNDDIHGSESYQAVMESVPLALANNLVPDLLFTYSDENIDSFKGIAEYAAKHRLVVILDPVFSIDGCDRVQPQTHRKALQYSRRPGVYLNQAHLYLRKTGGNNISKTGCRAVSSTLVILPDNKLALPCYHHREQALKIETNLIDCFDHPQRIEAIKKQGTYSFCKGCHINCYFDPSYTYQINLLYIMSMGAKIKYAFDKYVRYHHKIPRLW